MIHGAGQINHPSPPTTGVQHRWETSWINGLRTPQLLQALSYSKDLLVADF